MNTGELAIQLVAMVSWSGCVSLDGLWTAIRKGQNGWPLERRQDVVLDLNVLRMGDGIRNGVAAVPRNDLL